MILDLICYRIPSLTLTYYKNTMQATKMAIMKGQCDHRKFSPLQITARQGNCSRGSCDACFRARYAIAINEVNDLFAYDSYSGSAKGQSLLSFCYLMFVTRQGRVTRQPSFRVQKTYLIRHTDRGLSSILQRLNILRNTTITEENK